MAPGDSRRLARSGFGMVSCSLSFACSACSDGRRDGGWHGLQELMAASLCVRSVALAGVEHERSRAQATGSSVLCGSILSCSDGLEQRTQLRAARPRLQRLESDDDAGDGSEKPESIEQVYEGFDVKTFGGEAPGTSPPAPFPLLSPSGLHTRCTAYADRETETSPRCRVET